MLIKFNNDGTASKIGLVPIAPHELWFPIHNAPRHFQSNCGRLARIDFYETVLVDRLPTPEEISEQQDRYTAERNQWVKFNGG